MTETGSSQRTEAVRRFNRFYTQKIGVLRDGLLDSPFSLVEVRVLYELAHRKDPTASELAKDLGLDAGYLSRILRDFKQRSLIARKPSELDGRRSHLSLTKKGQRTFASLDARAREEVGAVLSQLAAVDQDRLVESMQTIEKLLGSQRRSQVPYIIRPHQPGDMGWVVHRHGVLYAREYGWDEQFEALVAEIVAKFIRHYEPKREHCWIAEREGEIVGSVFLVKRSKTVGQLRLLLVEPKARGLGIGARLVDECVRFARQVGYRKVTLWTNDVLHAARHIYEKAGFHLVHKAPHHSFGRDLVEQTWELKL
jgi:DNA-binding MarR family transcriptional regulator/N-acetylglutamate synthase-like GNAT family acetyltransferase